MILGPPPVQRTQQSMPSPRAVSLLLELYRQHLLESHPLGFYAPKPPETQPDSCVAIWLRARCAREGLGSCDGGSACGTPDLLDQRALMTDSSPRNTPSRGA